MNESIIYEQPVSENIRNILKCEYLYEKYKASLAQENIWGIKSCVATLLETSDFLIRIIHLHICLLLPFFLFKCLEIKFTNMDKNIFLLFVSLIFLSPTFRSLSIWPDSRLLGLLIFTIGIFFYLKFLDQKKFHYALKNVFFVALSAYFSPNFSIFSIFFFLNFIQFYGIKSKNIFYIFFLNIFLALPAIYYVFYLDINFLVKPAAIGLEINEKIIFNNIYND